jgi:hypothetical protein
VLAYVHQGSSGSASSKGAAQLLVDDDSILAASLAQVFDACAHLFGSVNEPQPPVGGFVDGRSHLYHASLTVACQNILLLALIESEQRAASSPKLLADVLSMPVGLPAMLVPDSH